MKRIITVIVCLAIIAGSGIVLYTHKPEPIKAKPVVKKIKKSKKILKYNSISVETLGEVRLEGDKKKFKPKDTITFRGTGKATSKTGILMTYMRKKNEVAIRTYWLKGTENGSMLKTTPKSMRLLIDINGDGSVDRVQKSYLEKI